MILQKISINLAQLSGLTREVLFTVEPVPYW
jgi:hypothetical protein